MRAWHSWFLVSLLACSPARQPPRPAPSAPAKRTVVVALVVDQMAARVFEMHAARWSAAKLGDADCRGFCRLMRSGTWFSRMEYAHAITDTAPGHASLFTGETPHVHGVGQNEKALLDPAARGSARAVGTMLDESTKLVDEQGATALAGPSLADLQVPTVADQLRQVDSNACIVSVSLKDRAALFGGGRQPTLTTFYEPPLRGFVSSSAFTARMPPGVGVRYPAGELERQVWTPRDPLWLGAHAPTGDDQPGEGSYRGLGSTFPHPLAGKPGQGEPNAAAAVRMTPFGDDAVRTVARQSLALCKDAGRSLVAVSFSSHDYILHGYGAHSWEAWDEMDRLDRTLDGLLQDLDRAFGKDAYAVVLSADHGSLPLPELSAEARAWCKPGAENRWDLPCEAGVRLAPGALLGQLEARAEQKLGKGPWIAAVTDPRVVLSSQAKALPAERRKLLVAELEAALLATGGVHSVLDLATLPTSCGDEQLGVTRPDIVQAVCHSEPSHTPSHQVKGDLYIVVKRGSFFDPGYTLGKGESHGSPWLYDRAVPLLVRPAGGGPARVHHAPVSFRTYARTIRGWFSLPSN